MEAQSIEIKYGSFAGKKRAPTAYALIDFSNSIREDKDPFAMY